ncbi:MAG: 4Fe-4S binding protein [Myxococcota bacterium]
MQKINTYISPFLTGFLVFLLQLLLYRESSISLSSNELNLGFFYFFWLSGMAAGAISSSKIFKNGRFLLLLVSFLFGSFILSHSRSIFSISDISRFSGLQSFFLIALSVLPAAYFSGTILPLFSKFKPKLLISLEAGGSLLAGAAYTFTCLSFLPSFYIFSFFVFPLTIFIPWFLWPKSGRNKIIFNVLKVFTLIYSFYLLSHSPQSNFLEHESFYNENGLTTISESKNGNLTLLHNNSLSFSFPGFYSEPATEFFSSLLSHKKNTKTIAVIEDFPLAYHLSSIKDIKVLFLCTDSRPFEYILEKHSKQPANLIFKEGDPHFHLKDTDLLILPSIFPLTLEQHKYISYDFLSLIYKQQPNLILVSGLDIPGLYPDSTFLENIYVFKKQLDSITNGKAVFALLDNFWIYTKNSDSIPENKTDFRKIGADKVAAVWTDPEVIEKQLHGFSNTRSSLDDPILFINALKLNPGGIFVDALKGVHSDNKNILFIITPKVVLPVFFSLLVILLFLLRFFRRPGTDIKPVQAGFLIFLSGFSAITYQIFLLLNLQVGTGSILVDIGLISGAFMFFFSLSSHKKYLAFKSQYQLAITALVLAIFYLSTTLNISTFNNLFFLTVFSSLSGLFSGYIFPLSFSYLQNHQNNLKLFLFLDYFGSALGAFLFGSFFLPALGKYSVFSALSISLFLTGICFFITFGIKTRVSPLRARSFPFYLPHYIIIPIFAAVLLSGTFISSQSSVSSSKPTGKMFEKPFPHYVIKENNKTLYKINSFDLDSTRNIKGYAAPIELVLTFDQKGIIRDAKIKSNQETPSYIKKMENYLLKYKGLKPDKNIYGKDGIDTVSGATSSSKAIRKTIFKIRKRFCSDILKITSEKTKQEHKSDFFIFPSLVVLLLFISALLSFFLKSNILRFITLVISVIFLGYKYNLMISLVDFGLLYSSLFFSNLEKIILFVLILITLFLFGNFWCGFLCPLGAIQEFILTFRRFILKLFTGEKDYNTILRSKKTKKTIFLKYLSFTRYLLLIVSLSLFALTLSQNFLDWDPLSYFFSLELATSNQILIALTLVVFSLFSFRPHCRFICPAGALFSLFNKINLLKNFFPVRLYNKCDFGVKSCRDITCINCNRCTLTKKTKKNSKKLPD